MRRFTPFGDMVLVLPQWPEEKQKTGGLAVPQAQKEKYATEGIVVAVGPGADITNLVDMERVQIVRHGNPAGVALGWRVQFAKYAGRKVLHEGREHYLLRLEELEGRIEDDAE
jgi:co-chaperonin GroES (HSP10)